MFYPLKQTHSLLYYLEEVVVAAAAVAVAIAAAEVAVLVAMVG